MGNRLSKIYTRTGDDGSTGLIGGQRVSKGNPRLDCYGTVDELNATLGVARAHDTTDLFGNDWDALQSALFQIGAKSAFALMVPALALGLVLWLYYGIGLGPGNPWMHAKLALVLLALAYHHACVRILRQLENNTVRRSHLWYRGFNEWPVLIMLMTVALVVIKPTDLGEFFMHLTLPVIALIVLAWVTIRAQRR